MNFERLLDVAIMLEDEVAPQRFDYNYWVDHTWKGKPDLSCGASACVLGWAAVLRPEWGMELRRTLHAHLGFVALKGRDTGDGRAASTSLATAQEVFDISLEEAEYLFTPDRPPPSDVKLPRSPNGEVDEEGRLHQPSARAVAQHIRQYVKYRQENPHE